MFHSVIKLNKFLGLFTVPCNATNTLYKLHFKQDDFYIAVDPEHYVIDLDLGNGKCALALGASDSSIHQEDYILGTPAIRSNCMSFDSQSQNILIYPLKPKYWNDFFCLKWINVKGIDLK